jgi:MSHA biogenesis protein MshJ
MSNSLNEEYKKLSIKFLKASLREQVLILCCGLIVITMMMYTLLLEPQLEKIVRVEKNSVGATQEITRLSAQVESLTNKLQDDPNQPIRERITTLEQKSQLLMTQLQSQTRNLVPANEMANVLEGVLSKSEGVTLIELESISPSPIILEPVEETEQEQPSTGLYRHGVKLVVQGSYFNIQTYLEKLEGLKWQFYWKKFDYIVDEYPLATVELEVYTLSTNKAFIGV